MYEGKPIIGIAGGIGSGKTHLARRFGELGACVISSDALVKSAYTHPDVKRAVYDMLGEDVFGPTGDVDLKAVGERVFRDLSLRQKLEKLLHPIVNEVRLERMRAAAGDDSVLAYVWDSPLLFETGLDKLCDAVVFVDTPREVRLERVAARGWDAAELDRRENLQIPLDNKADGADYVVRGGGDLPPAEPTPDESEEAACVAPTPALTPAPAEQVFAGILADAAQGRLRRQRQDPAACCQDQAGGCGHCGTGKACQAE